jgi:PhnB protein
MSGTAEVTPPHGYRSVTPYLAVDGAARAIGFYAEAFGARERMRLEMPGGKIGHAELEIGDAVVMLADPWPGGAFEAPRGETASVTIDLYVPDADAVFARAVAAGASAIRPVETHFYGDRGGMLRDPFGHHWHVAHRVEEVSLEEAKRRMAAQFGAG